MLPRGTRPAQTNGRTMSITIHIPDSVAQSLRLPEGEAEQRLRCSSGKASELASLSRYHFGDPVARRGIPRHYGEEELAEDLAFARGSIGRPRRMAATSTSAQRSHSGPSG